MGNRRDWENPDEMISVDDAFERIVAHFSALEPVRAPILDALGLVLAEDVVADVPVPPFQNSAMDGYAVRAGDTSGATSDAPVELVVIETLAAGAASRTKVSAGEAIRIMTGAPLPEGADTVVRFEETDESDRRQGARDPRIGVRREMLAHVNVREAGEDLQTGQLVMRAGTVIRPAEVSVLAALNQTEALVHRRPRVAILSTGDEVVPPGGELPPGKIRDTNSPMLAALVKKYNAEPIVLGIARDTTAHLKQRLTAADAPDLYVTSGGVSLGDYDMVKDVLQAEGEIEIWQVRMKPGKPLAFGRIFETPLLGLPGNPAAAMVSFEQFGRAAILKMLGHRDLRIPTVTARLAERVENQGGRRHFLRAWVSRRDSGYEVRSTGKHGSAMLSALVQSNCLAVIPEDADVLEPGAQVTVQLVDVTTGIPASDSGEDQDQWDE